MNNIFINLYNKVNLLFSREPWLVFKPIPIEIATEAGIESAGNYYKFDINGFIDVHIVMSGDEKSVNNKFAMINNRLAIICVLPRDLLSVSTPVLIDIVFKLYRFIINFIDTEMFRARLPYLFDYAPEILAMNTLLSYFKLEYDELTFIDKEKAIVFNQYSVDTLLDNGLVMNLKSIRGEVIETSNDKNS